jgi:radical SAM protein with 4Fe4S-binding SPASM domain
MLEATTYSKDRFISKKNNTILQEYYSFKKQESNFVCGYPFNILTVAFDGKIALCCNDFSASMEIGNIREGVSQVFHSKVLQRVRKEFYSQELDKCAECSFFHKPFKIDADAIKKEISKLELKYQDKIQTSF